MGVPCPRCAHGDTLCVYPLPWVPTSYPVCLPPTLCFPVIFPAAPTTYRRRRTRLRQMVHCVVRIQQSINKRNVRYRPFGKWPHLLQRVWKQETATEILNPLRNRETQGNSVARGARGSRTRCKKAFPCGRLQGLSVDSRSSRGRSSGSYADDGRAAPS